MKRFLLHAMMVLVGLTIGFVLPWFWYLDQLLAARFQLGVGPVPSAVYARPLELSVGSALTPAQLLVELDAARFQAVSSTSRPGSYKRDGNSFRIHTRRFTYVDGYAKDQVVQLTLAGGKISKLTDATGAALTTHRLDPAPIASLYGLDEADREPWQLARMPPILVQGVQAVEDRNFKDHHGIDPRGIARAIYVMLTSDKRQGASTLTQQLVRNTLLNNEYSLERKLKEIGLALLIEQRYDKGTILEAYLNRVVLGQNGNRPVQGFPAAAEFYFARNLDELSTAEIATLVGMLKATTTYNPRGRPKAAIARRNVVLDVFHETGLVSSDSLAALKGEGLDVVAQAPAIRTLYPAYLDIVRAQLRREYQESELTGAGLTVITNLDPFAQSMAEKALVETLGQLDKGGSVQGAVLVTRAEDGELLAAIGGRDPREVGFNRALEAKRQVGSLLKPFVYLLALSRPERYGLPSLVLDAPIEVRQAGSPVWRPRNSSGRSYGEVTLVDALSKSLNQATARLGLEIGVDRLAELMSALGVSPGTPVRPSLLLGAVDLSPLEVTQLYQGLASFGHLRPLHAIRAVLDSNGRALTAYPRPARQPASSEAIKLLILAMNETTRTGTARSLRSALSIDVAGKTGTTDGQRDSWYAGFTGEHLAVVWLGNDDNTPTKFSGSSGALRVWSQLFKTVPSAPLRVSFGPEVRFAPYDSGSGCDNVRFFPVIGPADPPRARSCMSALVGF